MFYFLIRYCLSMFYDVIVLSIYNKKKIGYYVLCLSEVGVCKM